MAKKTTSSVPMGAIAVTSRTHSGSQKKGSGPHTWEFFIRPSSDEANERIAKILMSYKGDIAEYEQCMEIPGYDEKQNVYAVKKSLMDDVSKNHAVRGDYKAFVRRTPDGKLYRHRTPEQIEAAKRRRLRKLIRRANVQSAQATKGIA